MPIELIGAVVVIASVSVWVIDWRRRRREGRPFPDVPDAPPSAEPMATHRPIDDGLYSYWLDHHGPRSEDTSERRSSD